MGKHNVDTGRMIDTVTLTAKMNPVFPEFYILTAVKISGLWGRVLLYVVTNVSKERIGIFFRV
jgi:hypothetical protein